MRRSIFCLILGLLGCTGGGESVPPPAPEPLGNSAAQSVSVVVDAADASAELSFTLVDPESETLRVKVEHSRNGVDWFESVVDPAETASLAATPAGVRHTIGWDALHLGFRGDTSGFVRVVPYDAEGRGERAQAAVADHDFFHLKAGRIDDYMIHYLSFSEQTIRVAETYDLVIVHPFSGQLTPNVIRDIQDGVDPDDPADDVLVLGYISVGEDLRTIGVTDEEMLQDPRFVGDGTGPRIDPRGPDADGQPLTGLDPLGVPSTGGLGYASYYLDDNDVDRTGVGDGRPDRNVIFGGCFTNAGDPKWFEVLDAMLYDGADGVPGIRELLTDDYGRGYACDGLFLDTYDTCAPNWFTDSTSPNQSEFEWTAAGFRDFTKRLKETYPNRLVLQNRGLFLFDPRYPHYEVTTTRYVDYVKFESFRLNSNTFEEFDPFFFPDNKYNVAPKVMVEANRPYGFMVLSLGYAEGPGISLDTLIGRSTEGLRTLFDDIVENQELMGMRHYLTDGGVAFPNTFVRDNTNFNDTEAPHWATTYNPKIFPFPTPPGEPDPRVGIQELVASTEAVTVRWDVALDLNRVRYRLYYGDAPFDFVNDPDLETATAVDLVPDVGAGYAKGIGPTIYAHEARLPGLARGITYYFCVRAYDTRGNEEKNQVVLSTRLRTLRTITIDGSFGDWEGVPLSLLDPADVGPSAGPDWREIQVANDLDNLYVRYSSATPFNVDGSPAFGFSRTLMMIDVDDDATTGYGFGSIGSELLIAGETLYGQATGAFNDGALQDLPMLPLTNVTECELSIPLSRIRAAFPNATKLRLVFFNDDAGDLAPDSSAVEYTLIED